MSLALTHFYYDITFHSWHTSSRDKRHLESRDMYRMMSFRICLFWTLLCKIHVSFSQFLNLDCTIYLTRRVWHACYVNPIRGIRYVEFISYAETCRGCYPFTWQYCQHPSHRHSESQTYQELGPQTPPCDLLLDLQWYPNLDRCFREWNINSHLRGYLFRVSRPTFALAYSGTVLRTM